MPIPLLENIKTAILNPLIGFLFSLALIYFLWGMVELFGSKNNEERLTQAKARIMWGLVGMFIMVTAFGIMRLICNSIGATC